MHCDADDWIVKNYWNRYNNFMDDSTIDYKKRANINSINFKMCTIVIYRVFLKTYIKEMCDFCQALS